MSSLGAQIHVGTEYRVLGTEYDERASPHADPGRLLIGNREYRQLLGATETGTMFTMANIIAQLERPTLVLAS